MSLTTVFLVLAVGLLFEVWRSHVRLSDAIGPRIGRPHGNRPQTGPPWLPRYPSVTVIRPIRGLDFGAEDNIRAALDNGYPGDVQTLFVFDDPAEPAVPIVRAAIDRHAATGGHGSAAVVFCGPPPSGRTGKLNAMMAGLREATGEILAFVDSDVRPDRRALRRVVETLLDDPTSGAAFAPVVVTAPPQTAGDVGYALLLNGLYGPALRQTAEAGSGSVPFLMGQFMVIRREALRAIGGLESLTGQLVDDMVLGALLHGRGYANKVSPQAVPILQRELSLRDFWSVYVRWITFSRTGLSGRAVRISSIVRALVWWTGFVAAGVAAALGAWVAAAILMAAPIGVSLSINRLHERLGGAPLSLGHQWLSFALLLSSPAVYAATLTRRRLAWRGRVYDLDATSKLDAAAMEQRGPDGLPERSYRV